jgi:hypothetical protein
VSRTTRHLPWRALPLAAIACCLLLKAGPAGAATRRAARAASTVTLASRTGIVTVALANKTARIVWALLVKGGTYRAPAMAA